MITAGAIYASGATGAAAQKAISFNGVDEYAYVDNPTFAANTQGCVLFEFISRNPVLVANSQRQYFGMGGTAAGNGVWRFGQRFNSGWHATNNYFAIFTRREGAANRQLYGSTVYVQNTRYRVIWQSDGFIHSMYINSTTAETLTVHAGANDGDWIGDIGANGADRVAIGNLYQNGGTTGNWNQDDVIQVAHMPTSINSSQIAEFMAQSDGDLFQDLSFAGSFNFHAYMGEGDDIDTNGYLTEQINADHMTTVAMDNTNIINAVV